jgi:hypothetical protein
MTDDYLAYYNSEHYLFDVVRPRFHATGGLDAFDLFSIIIWKANRAKSKIARRLIRKAGDVETAARAFTNALHIAPTAEQRLAVAIGDWGFLLPMASAILCVLWPDDFTVYDVRVCDELNDFHSLGGISRLDRLWAGYQQYAKAVDAAVPGSLCLRDKDRLLWARSAAKQLQQDVSTGFGAALGENRADSSKSRFTDQPQMESAEARYDDDYWAGHGDAGAGRGRDERGSSQYHKGYSDAIRDGHHHTPEAPRPAG